MNVFEKIQQRLREKYNDYSKVRVDYAEGLRDGYIGAMTIVSEVEAEYANPKTNADSIRAMSDEELAAFIENAEAAGYNDSSITPRMENGYSMDMLEWLQSPIKKEEET